jgi:hypothetical protein
MPLLYPAMFAILPQGVTPVNPLFCRDQATRESDRSGGRVPLVYHTPYGMSTLRFCSTPPAFLGTTSPTSDYT